jgi:hypothetical protein
MEVKAVAVETIIPDTKAHLLIFVRAFLVIKRLLAGRLKVQ